MSTHEISGRKDAKEILRALLSPSLARFIKTCLFIPRYITSNIRLLPDFIIIGVQRGGTTSLYHYLTSHPNVAPAFLKEVHFFDFNFQRGINWYRSHFSSALVRGLDRFKPKDIITGESSPFYVFHPHVPGRIFNLLPKAKLIVMLRNPIERAYSHYQHEKRLGIEQLSFEEAIRAEETRLTGEMDRLKEDEHYYSFNLHHFSYLRRGQYIKLLLPWINLFPHENMLIIRSESFFQTPAAEFRRVVNFLGLPEWQPPRYQKYNSGIYKELLPALRGRLARYYEPFNRQLYERLGTDFGWE